MTEEAVTEDFDLVNELTWIYESQVQILSAKMVSRDGKKALALDDKDIKRLLDLTKGVRDLESIGAGRDEEEDHEARNASVEKLKEALNRPTESKA